jgi:tRNA U38,U39,U40 pseudouridine synthase TruA
MNCLVYACATWCFLNFSQIRIMVGTAMHVGTGVLPEYMVKLAMLSSFHFVLPIAPANGLVLSTCGFGHPKSNTPVRP